MNFWWRYPMWDAMRFMSSLQAEGRKKREMAHILRIGPIAFVVVWQEDVPERERA